METTHHVIHEEPRGKSAAINALAVVGFIALILLGMGLAIYAARFMPVALSHLGQAAASLGSAFTVDKDDAQVEVVDNRPAGAVVTLPISPSAPAQTAPAPAAHAAPSYTYTAPAANTGSTPTGYTFVNGGSTYTSGTYSYNGSNSASYFGDPDLTVEILEVGYLRRSGDTDSFERASRVPSGKDGAVKFRLSNRGTDVSGRFDLEIEVKTSSGRATDRISAPSMNPNTSVVSVGYFDSNKRGNVDITLEVDPQDRVDESNERNNDDTVDIDARD